MSGAGVAFEWRSLMHGLAVRDRTPCDAGTNLNGRIFSFHFSESYAGRNLSVRYLSKDAGKPFSVAG